MNEFVFDLPVCWRFGTHEPQPLRCTQLSLALPSVKLHSEMLKAVFLRSQLHKTGQVNGPRNRSYMVLLSLFLLKVVQGTQISQSQLMNSHGIT